MTMERRKPAMEQLMYRPAEAAQVLGIGRTRVFALIKSGRLRSVKLGGARFITAEALRAFVRDLEQESSGQADAEVA
jgi:excisionase family DNA binding protein